MSVNPPLLPVNLNEMPISHDELPYGMHTLDWSTNAGEVKVYFRNLKEHLIEFIEASTHIYGCVAWLTDPDILEALSKTSCTIVVQKEDFLRPDWESTNNFKVMLKKAYSKLKNTQVDRYCAPGTISGMSACGDPTIEPVRVVGNYNNEKKPAFPRMHNKFIVSCRGSKLGPIQGSTQDSPEEHSVWTGSFNFTKNASNSFENALVLEDPRVVQAYTCEWANITALSENLNWHAEWCAPEWRIGT